QHRTVVAGDVDQTVRSETVNPVSRGCGAVDVDEDVYGVHRPRRATAAHQGRSGDFHVEREGAEVGHHPETSQIDVRIQHGPGCHGFRGYRRPIAELTVNLDRIGRTTILGDEEQRHQQEADDDQGNHIQL